VPTAAGTWINMEDAYFQEKNDVGDWTEIGYSAPGVGSSHSYESNVFYYSDNNSDAWYASPKVKLNDCGPGSAGGTHWGLTATANASSTAAATAFQIANASTGGANCLNLTASWSALTRSSN
jgi:hypothetical protein